MASSSLKASFQDHLDLKMRSTSTPMCTSLDDSGYHSKDIDLIYTPYLNLNRRNLVDTPIESPLPPSAFSSISSSDSVIQVLFEDEDLGKVTDDYLHSLSRGSLNETSSEYSEDVELNNVSCAQRTVCRTQNGSIPDCSKELSTSPRKPKYYSVVPWPGQEIGELYIDFFRELGHFRNCSDVVYRICDYLTSQDLVSAGQVSHTWRSLIENNNDLKRRRTSGLESCYRGNFGKENHRNGKSLFRVPKPIGNALRLAGNQMCTPQKLSPVKVEPLNGMSRLPLFQEQAKKLLPCEHLQPCPRCQSPSRVTPAEKRAHCTRTQCSFDYCTQCRNIFHAPVPCKKSAFAETRIRSPKKRDLICHKGARRNLRRL